jgi:Tfp pilus assembly protein FimT
MIELMIVLVIFGLLVGFGLPSYQKYSRSQKLRGTSENLVQTIQLQRSRAMATGQDIRINFNTAAPAAWTCMGEGRSTTTPLPNGVSYVSATPNFLVLSRDGRSNASGEIIFTNTEGRNDTVSVMLSGLALIR